MRKYDHFHSLHHFCRKLKANSVRLRILSSDTNGLKSTAPRGVLFKTTMHGIPALFAASTPNGAFSTTIDPVFLTFSFSTAESSDDGSGFPFVTSSAVIITSNCSFPNPTAWSKMLSTSFFEEPLTTALRHRKFVTNSFTLSKGLKLNTFLKYSSFLFLLSFIYQCSDINQ